MCAESLQLETDHDDLRTLRWTSRALDDLVPGTVRLRVDSFVLSANNVTYALAGDQLGYWRIWPSGDPTWCRVPVWGHATVEDTACEEIEVGARYFGLWTPATQVVVQPVRITPDGFVDGARHRAELAPIYQRYQRVASSSTFDDDVRLALWQPLFALSFLVGAWLEEESVFGASTVVLTSASSKTAIGLAQVLRGRVRVVGLTSPRNAAFVSSTGLYDGVLSYDSLPRGLPDEPSVLVDMAGSADVARTVQDHLGDRLLRSVGVGLTHQSGAPCGEFFFAPDHAQRLARRWGPGGLAARLDAARAELVDVTSGWLEIDVRRGPAAIEDAWLEVLAGDTDPRRVLAGLPS